MGVGAIVASRSAGFDRTAAADESQEFWSFPNQPSDRGSGQAAHLLQTVGSKGDSYDNALAETINGLYKAELIHRRGPWKTMESVELATLEWVSWFNHQRLMEPLGYIPPAEIEASYYRQLDSQAAIAA